MKRVVFSLVTVLLALLVLELVARVTERALGARIERLHVAADTVLRPDPGRPGHLAPAPDLLVPRVFGAPPMVAQSFTATPATGVARVLLVGGSSVVNLAAFREALREALRAEGLGDWTDVEILVGGVNSGGSEVALEVVRGFREARPDLVVVYSGHNEFVAAATWRRDEPAWVDHIASVRLAGKAGAIAWLATHALQRRIGTDAPEDLAWRVVLAEADLPPTDEVVAGFASNLEALVREARAGGADVVIGTVASNQWDLVVRGLPGEPQDVTATLARLHAEGALVEAARRADAELAARPHDQATSAENARIVEVARALDVPLVDVAAAVAAAEPHGVSGETLFTDHCHLDDAGNRVWVRVMAPVIAARLRGRPAR